MQDHNNILSQNLKRSASLLAAFMMMSFTTSGLATVITSGCSEATSCTFEELIAGGSISVNDKVFENWGLDFNSLVSDFSQVVVTGLDNGGYDPVPGLRYEFNGQFLVEVSGEIELDTVFHYEVATTEEHAFINDASLTLIDYQFEGVSVSGRVGVDEYILQTRFDPNTLIDSL